MLGDFEKKTIQIFITLQNKGLKFSRGEHNGMIPPTDQLSFDIAIVGLGPVGATLANILGQYELSTIILERDPETHHLPRAVAFDDEVMRIFQSIELANQINEIVEVGAGAHFVDMNG